MSSSGGFPKWQTYRVERVRNGFVVTLIGLANAETHVFHEFKDVLDLMEKSEREEVVRQ